MPVPPPCKHPLETGLHPRSFAPRKRRQTAGTAAGRKGRREGFIYDITYYARSFHKLVYYAKWLLLIILIIYYIAFRFAVLAAGLALRQEALLPEEREERAAAGVLEEEAEAVVVLGRAGV